MPKELKGLSFKPVETKRTRVSYKPRRLSKLIYAVCVKDKETGEHRAYIVINNNPHRTILNISFSLDSYSLKGKERVFSKRIDPQTKKHICYIRTPREAAIAPTKSKLYTPFCENWVYSGYIVRIGKQNYFDIKEAIWHKDFIREDLEVNPEDIHL